MGAEIAAMSVAACGVANKYGNDTRKPLERDLDEFRRRQIQQDIAQNQAAAGNVQDQVRGLVGQRRRLMIDEAQSIPKEIYMTKRLVRVFLVDPNESVPLDSSMLYKSDEKLTDLTDQELFFEIPVQELLTKHNALRATLIDKAASKRSNKDVLLEPAKIRDLTMTVLVLETW